MKMIKLRKAHCSPPLVDEDNSMVFTSHSVPFPATSDRGTRGWKWHLVRDKKHFIFFTPVTVNKYSLPYAWRAGWKLISTVYFSILNIEYLALGRFVWFWYSNSLLINACLAHFHTRLLHEQVAICDSLSLMARYWSYCCWSKRGEQLISLGLGTSSGLSWGR